MVDKPNIPVTGECPSVEEISNVSPQWDSEEEQYICPQCGRQFGDIDLLEEDPKHSEVAIEAREHLIV